MKNRFLVILFILVSFIFTQKVDANVVYSANTHTQLVSEFQAVQPGQTFKAAVHFKMNPHWHVYWRNPGDSGIAPFIEWDLPKGVTVSELQWPMPEHIRVDPMLTYGYHQEVLLPFDVEVDERFSDQQVILRGNLEYLACKEICIPGRATLELSLLVGPTQEVTSWARAINKQDYPGDGKALNVKVYDEGKTYLIEWSGGPFSDDKTYFFPYRDDVIEHAKPQEFIFKNKMRSQLRIQKSDYHPESLSHMEGVLSTGQTIRPSGYTFDVPILAKEIVPFSSSSSSMKLWIALLFAFIGGIILNLMPCVLPVLSIKILNIVQHAQDNRQKVIKDGFLFSLGILCAFWVLAGILIALKSAGQEIGWGFQFQSPAFVTAMIILFTLLALNLFGIFEIGMNFNRFRFMQKGGAFWEGVLATIVATPCTAPFMGSALGYALTQSALVSFLVFTFLGLGLATPFILLIVFPSLMRFAPKPGPWMIQLKRFFGILFLLTVVWLIWILSLQVNVPFLPKAKVSSEISWQKFSPEIIEKYRAENKVVFLDFTARWCLTCQVNERLALSNKEVIQKFKELNVVMVKADWTNYDEEITEALAELGRNAIPLYVLYPKNKGDPVLLPELITPKIILKYLEK